MKKINQFYKKIFIFSLFNLIFTEKVFSGQKFLLEKCEGSIEFFLKKSFSILAEKITHCSSLEIQSNQSIYEYPLQLSESKRSGFFIFSFPMIQQIQNITLRSDNGFFHETVPIQNPLYHIQYELKICHGTLQVSRLMEIQVKGAKNCDLLSVKQSLKSNYFYNVTPGKNSFFIPLSETPTLITFSSSSSLHQETFTAQFTCYEEVLQAARNHSPFWINKISDPIFQRETHENYIYKTRVSSLLNMKKHSILYEIEISPKNCKVIHVNAVE